MNLDKALRFEKIIRLAQYSKCLLVTNFCDIIFGHWWQSGKFLSPTSHFIDCSNEQSFNHWELKLPYKTLCHFKCNLMYPRGQLKQNSKLIVNFSNSEANLQQLVDNEPLPGFPSAAKSNSNLAQGRSCIFYDPCGHFVSSPMIHRLFFFLRFRGAKRRDAYTSNARIDSICFPKKYNRSLR